jgi:peroxin-5
MPSYELSEESNMLAHPAVKRELSSNPTALSQIDFMAEGYKHFDAGNLSRAITYFEAELQLRPDNVMAWTVLGKCHAENENDRSAIACLEHAVEHDPYALEALLPLGVSYVNELDTGRALRTLQAWVEHNPTYAGLEMNNEVEANVRDSSVYPGMHTAMLNEVKELLHQALHHSLTEDVVASSSVHEALGVCYNVSQEYDVAAQHMQKALEGRPNDYALWNKLGATMANGNRSDEALPDYMKALELKPKYARAWLNMAIAHSNLKQYDEAARCYLQTLSLNPEAVHCWGYLRIALTCIERWDLISLAASQDLREFHKHFDFVDNEKMG